MPSRKENAEARAERNKHRKKRTKNPAPDNSINPKREDGQWGRARHRMSRANTAILRGEVPLEEWDMDELLRGRKRNKNGSFSGRPPTMVPKAVHDELMRRTLQEVNEYIRQAAVPAAQKLLQMVQRDLGVLYDDDGRPYNEQLDATQLRAVQEVLNRVLGKVKDNVEITATIKPWEEVAREAHIIYDDEDIEDAEIVEDLEIEEEYEDEDEEDEYWEEDDEDDS